MEESGGAVEQEYCRLNSLNRIAHEVSANVRGTLERVQQLHTADPDRVDDAATLLVASIRSLSNVLEGLFDSFHHTLPSTDTTGATARVTGDTRDDSDARRRQLRLSEGLLKWMKKLILKGVQLIQEAKLVDRPAYTGLADEFKVILQSLLLDLREILRLQHCITDEPASLPAPSSLPPPPSPPSTTSSSSALSSSVSSSSSGGADVTWTSRASRAPADATPAEAAHCGLTTSGSWVRGLTMREAGGNDARSETGESPAPARSFMDPAVMLRRRAMHQSLSSSPALGAASSIPYTSPTPSESAGNDDPMLHPYRSSRIVYGFQVKEGAMKLKVELQHEMESDDTSRDSKRDKRTDISDEQFVDMMIQFFREMETSTTTLPSTPSSPSLTDSSVTLTPSLETGVHSLYQSSAASSVVDHESKPQPPTKSAPPNEEVYRSPNEKEVKQTRRQMRMKESRPRMREGRWYFCVVS